MAAFASALQQKPHCLHRKEEGKEERAFARGNSSPCLCARGLLATCDNA